MKIDVRQSSEYKYLTKEGKEPAKLNNGYTKIDADELAVQAETICNMLCGKGFNYYQIAMILDTAKDALREARLKQVY